MKSIQAIRSRLPLSFILVGGLCLLLPVLAFLQYQWIGQISESERERLEEGLDASTRRFVDDIVGEFSSIALSFQTQPPTETFPLEDQLARNLNRWNRTAPYPSIIKSVYVSTPDADGELNLLRFDPESGTLVTIPWSEATEPLKERLGQLTDFSRARFDFRRNSAPDRARISGNQISENNDSAWILAPMIAAIDLWEGNIDRGFTGWTLVEIDTRAFASDLLPDVVETHFDPEDYEVVIFESNQSDEIVFRSEEELSRDTMASPDVAIRALAPQPPPSDGLAPARGRSRGRGRVPRRSMGFGLPPEGLRPGLGPQAVPFTLFGASWQLVAQHQLGSLESAVSTLRARNLFVGLGILALLGVSGILTIIWSERVRSIGQLQMEFAAGISHELRTPLTTIRTAAHNIASGVVSKPEEVREYAAMVKAEGRRLSQMVDQVIQFAQTESGRRDYDLRPVDVEHVVESALSVIFPSSEEALGKVRIDIDPELPPVLADETALGHSLGNLIVNALKYGPADEVVVIGAHHDKSTDRIQLSVSNSGGAINPSDLGHLFEPFFRGRHVGPTPGSGLGLSLVRRMIEGQNGEVTVSSEPGNTSFTLHVPLTDSSQ